MYLWLLLTDLSAIQPGTTMDCPPFQETSSKTRFTKKKTDLLWLLSRCKKKQTRYNEYIIKHHTTGATHQSFQCMCPISITCWLALWKTDRQKEITKHASLLSAVTHNQRRRSFSTSGCYITLPCDVLAGGKTLKLVTTHTGKTALKLSFNTGVCMCVCVSTCDDTWGSSGFHDWEKTLF